MSIGFFIKRGSAPMSDGPGHIRDTPLMRPRRCEDKPDMLWMRGGDSHLAGSLTAESAAPAELVPLAGKRSLTAFALAASALVAMPLSLLVRRRRSIETHQGMAPVGGGLPTSPGNTAPQAPYVAAVASSSSRDMI